MKSRSPLHLGLLAGVLFALSALAAHWFLTPHPEAGGVRTALVGLQLVGGAGLALWAYRRGRRRERELEQGQERGSRSGSEASVS